MTFLSSCDTANSVAPSSRYWRNELFRPETGQPATEDVLDERAQPLPPPVVIELDVAGKVRLRIPLTTPPTLAAAMVKARGVS
ncbi:MULTISPECIES: transposase [Mesorhizobium]|uniref:transposase n=1 Tax=Mesorhizobium TaxID=68287 RepID=UPI000ADA266D|nr:MULTISPECIES: transposase [Mesorhizobium]MCF6101616.1 transposase [Mesorhizobium muleiense]